MYRRGVGLCLGAIVCFGPYNRLLSDENMEIGDSAIWNEDLLFSDKTIDLNQKFSFSMDCCVAGWYMHYVSTALSWK